MQRNDDAPGERPRPAAVRACLAAIVLLALAARVWGSFIGLPHAYLPDETSKLDSADRLPQNGFRGGGNQPGFLPLSLLAVRQATRALEPALRAARLPGGRSLDDVSGVAVRLWIARLWLDVLSAATVPVAFLLARRLAGARAGLIAAALLALNPLAIASANYVKEDTPLALWLVATTLAAVELRRRRTPLSAIVAGVAAGLAFGSKYVGVIALPLLALGLRGRSAPTRRLVALAAAGFGTALLVTTPDLLLAPMAIARGLAFQASYATTGHHDGIALPITETRGVLYLRAALVPSLGLPALMAAVVGLLVLLARDRATGLLLAASTLGLVLLIEAMPAKPYPFFARYALPAIPGLCVLAGVGCAHAASWLAAHRASRAAWSALIAAIVVAWPAATTIRFTRGMYPDSRDQAAAWLLENVAQRSWVLPTPYGPALPPGRFRIWPLVRESGARRILERLPAVKYIVLSDLYTARFAENPFDMPDRTAFLARVAVSGVEVARFAARGPRFGFYHPTISVRRVPAAAGPRLDAPHPRDEARRSVRDEARATKRRLRVPRRRDFRHAGGSSRRDRRPRREPLAKRGRRARYASSCEAALRAECCG